MRKTRLLSILGVGVIGVMAIAIALSGRKPQIFSGVINYDRT